MLEDRAGNMWVGVDDGLYLFKNGHFRRLPEPNHQPLGLVVGLAEDIDGNIWAECQVIRRSLVRIRDFQVREEFPASQVPPGRTLAPDPQGGIWIGTKRRPCTVPPWRSEDILAERKGIRSFNQIIASADGSVLAGFRRRAGRIAARQGAADDDEKRPALQFRDLLLFRTRRNVGGFTPIAASSSSQIPSSSDGGPIRK